MKENIFIKMIVVKIRKSHVVIAIASIIIMFVFTMTGSINRQLHPVSKNKWANHLPDEEMLKVAKKLVKMEIIPPLRFSFGIMKPGVLQHLDRPYTYDLVPPELIGGLLFQGIHRPPKGTTVSFQLFSPAKVYFFFHHKVDGGYSEIFSKLDDWKHLAVAPQYDINNGDHGLKMVMYQLDAEAGTYTIPATTEDRAAFNILFQ